MRAAALTESRDTLSSGQICSSLEAPALSTTSWARMSSPGLADAASPADTANSMVMGGMKPAISLWRTRRTFLLASTETTWPVRTNRRSAGGAGAGVAAGESPGPRPQPPAHASAASAAHAARGRKALDRTGTPIRRRKKLSKRLSRARWHLPECIPAADGNDTRLRAHRRLQACAGGVFGAVRRLGVRPRLPGGVHDDDRRRHGLPGLAALQRVAQPARLADAPGHVRGALPPAERGRDDDPDDRPRVLGLAGGVARMAAQARVFRARARGRPGGPGRPAGAPRAVPCRCRRHAPPPPPRDA